MKNKFKIILLFTGLLFALILIFLPFLHNHAPTLFEKSDCPACLLQMNLIFLPLLLLTWFITSLINSENFYYQSVIIKPSNFIFSTFANKAPPSF